METRIIQKEKTKVVPDGFLDVEVYITKDRRQFLDKEEAFKHEKKLLDDESFNQRYRLNTIYLDQGYDVIFIENLNYGVEAELCRKYHNLDPKDLKQGINLIRVDDSGDHVYCYAYPYEEMVAELGEQLNKLKDLKQKMQAKVQQGALC